ncbi:MAG: cytochrome c-type biogenesis protein [Betaproteobacteria bacterium]
MAERRIPRSGALLALWLAIALPLAAVAADDAASAPTGAASVTASAPEAAAIVKFQAPAATLTAADPALEARMLAITSELRCLVCQNQTIADSHADLAVDLRQEVRELIKRGQTDAQIRRYMTDRYGDFILYRPPLKGSTAVLWLGPAGLLAIAVFALIVVISRRARLADDHFEPDPVWEGDAPDPSSEAPARPGAPA